MKSIFMKLFIIGLCVSFFPIQAIAGGFTGFHQIEWVYARQCRPDQNFEVQLLTPHDNPDGCSNARVLTVECKQKKFLKEPAATQIDLFLTAFTEDYFVQAFVNGCDGNGYAIVKAVQVQKAIP